MSVIFSHSHILLGHGATDPRRTLMGGALYLGALCLNGFFVVSGYLVTASWARSGGAGEFLKSRARRIVPGFAAAFVVSVALAAACSAAPAERSTRSSRRARDAQGAEVDGAYPHNPFAGNVNGSMWTIAPEVAHYLLLLALGSAGALRRSVVLPVLAGTAVLYALDVRLALPWAMRDAPRLTAFFFAGIAFRLLGDRARVGRGRSSSRRPSSRPEPSTSASCGSPSRRRGRTSSCGGRSCRASDSTPRDAATSPTGSTSTRSRCSRS